MEEGDAVFLKKKDIKIKQPVINAVVTVAAISLLLYVVFQLVGNSNLMVSTQKTQVVTDTDYAYGKGYIFRDETVILSDSGIVDRLVPDGARVRVGSVYAELYSSAGLGNGKTQQLQEKLDELGKTIDRIGELSSSNTEVSDLGRVNESLLQAYYDYVSLVVNGEMEAADVRGEQLLDAIVDYRIITGRDGAAENILSSLKAERSALLSNLGAVTKSYVDDKSFYFFYEIDGYEEIFSSNAVADMSAESLNELINTSSVEYDGVVVGKKAHTAKWYMAMPVDEAESYTFLEGSTYAVTLTSSSRSINMLLEKVYVGDDGAYLLFSSYDLSKISDLGRAQDIKIKLASCTGYRIPREALVSLDGESGVYILVGSTVEFRRVTVIAEKGMYYIANTRESDADEGSVSSIPYLKVNDLIITSGNDLYDGKRLD